MCKCKRRVYFLAFCLAAIRVQSLNYDFRNSYQPWPVASELSSKTGAGPNRTENNLQKLNKTGVPYVFIHPLIFPQNRGGKYLNFTLGTEPPTTSNVQPRILNNPYPNSPYFNDAFKEAAPNVNISPRKQNDKDILNLTIQENSKIAQPKTPQRVFNNKKSLSELPPDHNSYVDWTREHQRQSKDDTTQQRISKTLGVLSVPNIQKFNTDSGFHSNIPPQLYQKVPDDFTEYPVRQDNIQNWPCFCVPYYLCKNGLINSGGRSVATLQRKSRSLIYKSYKNKTLPFSSEPKVANTYVFEQVSEPSQCDEKKVCCRLSFGDDVGNNPNDDYYPVATPLPEPYYPNPPRFPNKRFGLNACGIRRAYGIQARLKQLQYSADVSEFGEYPWQVAVLRKIEGQKSLYLCGGVLLSLQWVATAAHCIKKEQFSPLIIRLGEWDVNRKDEIYPYVEKDADSVVLHPEFNSDTLYNDIALIHMRSPVDPNLPHVTPACLPRRGMIYEDQRCWVSGWGKDFFGPQGEYQNVLKEVDVPVVSRAICTVELRSTNLGPKFILHPGFLCAGGEAGKDACTGDGGSPLVCRNGQTWYVLGLVSWGIGCGQPRIPGVYVNMLYYVDWINSIIYDSMTYKNI